MQLQTTPNYPNYCIPLWGPQPLNQEADREKANELHKQLVSVILCCLRY